MSFWWCTFVFMKIGKWFSVSLHITISLVYKTYHI
jgi:hypothetical protein